MNDRTENPDPGGPPRVRGARPWTRLPSEVHAVVAPLLPRISDETVQTIGREIPAYTRPFEGEFGDVVRTGVEQALVQFAEMIRVGSAVPEEGRALYVALGRGELRAGRSIGALLAAAAEVDDTRRMLRRNVSEELTLQALSFKLDRVLAAS